MTRILVTQQLAPILRISALVGIVSFPWIGFFWPKISLASPSPTPHAELLLAQQGLGTFFEEGRLSSENEITFKRQPSGVRPIAEQSRYWQPIVFKAGQCSLWMPPGTLTQDTKNLDTRLGSIRFITLASDQDQIRYVAAYAGDLTAEQSQTPQSLFTALKERVAPSNQFVVKGSRALTLDSQYPGEEWSLQSSEESITFRVYVVGQRVYALGARYGSTASTPRPVTAFLNSFELLSR